MNRHLELAFSFVKDSWFPISPEAFARIKAGLELGLYDGGRDLLIQDLKKDLGLFTYTLKKLSEHSSDSNRDPIQVLKDATLEDLKSILSTDPALISKHRIFECSSIQRQRLQATMISTSTAEVMSENLDVDSDLAYTSALFRQLGLTLIAWNYPHVYRRVIGSLKSEDDLDTQLGRVLGFSPSMLGVTIAKRWGLSTEFRAAIGDDNAKKEVGENKQLAFIADTLERVCLAGEALARASDPDHYPSAQKDWEFAQREIVNTLGPVGFEQLTKKLKEHCEYYAKTAPELFNLPEQIGSLAKEGVGGAKPAAVSLISTNIYLKYLTPPLQSKFEQLYANINGHTIQKENVDFLIKEIIPAAGYFQGAIYLVDPDTNVLVPRLAINGSKLSDFKRISLKMTSAEFDPIVAAYRAKNPIAETNVLIDDRRVSYIAGALGDIQKAGVIYLEVPEDLPTEQNSGVLVTFKAIRIALTHCLNLN